ncbi:PEP-CTERM sorting domain-containing protein [Cognaticolwellia mytili]|uniref:PEP-CTERM sorting domain-containing protein n=1 Tax=Cognaticolwellia mytili TaxID=1888913 RepID=UPI000A17857D|nr:PEP-CTERM sorting domain-containing protein [Cognaticolwellia mytili]
MLKKLLTAGILLCVSLSMSANAALMGINGSFDVFGLGETTLNAAGEVTDVDFSFNSFDLRPQIISGDYQGYFDNNSIFSVKNPLVLSNIVGVDLWTVEGFTFTGTSIRENKTTGTSTGLYIIGNVSHADFITTETQWFFSTQGLSINGTTLKSFSSTITSPAPSVVSEPGTLALFGLSFLFCGLRRNKK